METQQKGEIMPLKKIDIEEFRNYKVRTQILAMINCTKNKLSKFLHMICSPYDGTIIFEVHKGKDLICDTYILVTAIEEYNKL